jgi:hypothetical protein
MYPAHFLELSSHKTIIDKSAAKVESLRANLTFGMSERNTDDWLGLVSEVTIFWAPLLDHYDSVIGMLGIQFEFTRYARCLPDSGTNDQRQILSNFNALF